MYRCVLQTEEGGREDVCTAGSLCVSTRNKHLYNIYIHLLFFFTPFMFRSCLWENRSGGGGSGWRSFCSETTSTLKKSREKRRTRRGVCRFQRERKAANFLPFSQRQNKRLGFGRPVGTRRGRSTTSCSVKGWAVTWVDLRVEGGGRGHQTECSEGL